MLRCLELGLRLLSPDGLLTVAHLRRWQRLFTETLESKKRFLGRGTFAGMFHQAEAAVASAGPIRLLGLGRYRVLQLALPLGIDQTLPGIVEVERRSKRPIAQTSKRLLRPIAGVVQGHLRCDCSSNA